jgi:hypothetical protein
VILGNNTEFERAVLWLSENLSFDVDARINLFEVCDWYTSWEKFPLVDVLLLKLQPSCSVVTDYSNLMKSSL